MNAREIEKLEAGRELDLPYLVSTNAPTASLAICRVALVLKNEEIV